MGTVYFAPMLPYETFFLLLAGCGAWLWLDSLKTREIGMAAVRQACRDEHLQLLDETVHCSLLRLARDDGGVLRLRRVYDFEYSDTGDNRRQGRLTMLGSVVEILHIRPQLYIVPKAPEPHENLD